MSKLSKEEQVICVFFALGLILLPTGIFPIQMLGIGLCSPFFLCVMKMYVAHAQKEREKEQLPAYAMIIAENLCRALDLKFCMRWNLKTPSFDQLKNPQNFCWTGTTITTHILIPLDNSYSTYKPSGNLLPAIRSNLQNCWNDSQWGAGLKGLSLQAINLKYLPNQQSFLLSLNIGV